MRTLTHVVGGSVCTINVPEDERDLVEFRCFMADNDGQHIAVDTETTGLDIYKPGHALRLVQFGNPVEAFVLDARRWGGEVVYALNHHGQFVMHNAPYDLLVLDHHLGVKVKDLAPRTADTRILAHLIDPRGKADGGIGHGLKALAEVYVDEDAPDAERELVKVFRGIGETKATGWAAISLDNEDFLRYAGLDVILTARLRDALAPLVDDLGLSNLSAFEHHLSMLLMLMQRRGIRVDTAYTQQLRDDLAAEAVQYADVAWLYGVENINSTAQVAEALAAMGETLREKTPSGKPKVDKAVLLPMADLDTQWHRIEARAPNPLADAVLRSKRAAKWGGAYVDAFLELKDNDDRLHPVLGGLQARTARMSVSHPPLQQLPSSDWQIRRCLVADPGQLIIASDYSQVELRVLAAMSGDETMLEAIASGQDLHDFTAERVFGPNFTKQHRKIAKAVSFGKVYGGGLTTIVRQTGADSDGVRHALDAYDATFPRIKQYARKLQRSAEYGRNEVITPSGRRLPLDRDRSYAAVNYVVQSTARDVLAQAIVDLFDKGLGDHLLLPVHDELVAQAPAEDAADVVEVIRDVMARDFGPVHLAADASVYGTSWGHGYGATDN